MARGSVRARRASPEPERLEGRLGGSVAVVVGGSRGAGRGIALALGDAGATVYVAARTRREGPRPSDGAPGTVEDTAEEVTRRGGRGIPVPLDATVEAEVAALFERVQEEQGRLDVLAVAVWGANEYYGSSRSKGQAFWELDEGRWRALVLGGAYAHLLAVVHGARLMAPRRRGLIACVTEPVLEGHPGGSLFWRFWALGHRAINETVEAAAAELRRRGIAVVALAPGFMRTERVLMHLKTERQRKAHHFDKAESTEYAGRSVVALAADPKALRHSGKLVYVADLARQYGFTDVDGRQVRNFYRVMGLI